MSGTENMKEYRSLLGNIIYMGGALLPLSVEERYSMEAVVLPNGSIQATILEVPLPVEGFDWSAFLQNTDVFFGVLLTIITGVSMIKGLRYLKSLKEKQVSATFTFWSQFKFWIICLYNFLSENQGLLGNLYPQETRKEWEVNQPLKTQVDEFKTMITEVSNYLKKAEDQMPAYEGWSQDFGVFLNFISYAIQYDIADSEKYFVPSSFESLPDYCKTVCNSMKNMIDGIERRQKEVEKELHSKSVWSRIYAWMTSKLNP